jgi:hypothetical protein
VTKKCGVVYGGKYDLAVVVDAQTTTCALARSAARKLTNGYRTYVTGYSTKRGRYYRFKLVSKNRRRTVFVYEGHAGAARLLFAIAVVRTNGGDGSGCDPNYAGACLRPDVSDYDCRGGSGDGPYYTGPVRIVGDDHYDLDRDGDGVACEDS